MTIQALVKATCDEGKSSRHEADGKIAQGDKKGATNRKNHSPGSFGGERVGDQQYAAKTHQDYQPAFQADFLL